MARVIKNVALAGATGNLGSRILKALIETGRFNITVLTRNASDREFASGVTVKEVDFGSLSSLTNAVGGQDAVIDSTYSSESEGPRRLIDACIAAGVYRYIPSEFGFDPLSKDVQALPVFKRKADILHHLTEKLKSSDLTWSAVANGAFLDFLNSRFLGFDFKNKDIALFGEEGFRTGPLTSLEAVGKATAQVLLHPEETRNRVVYISSAYPGQKKLVELAKEALGPDGWRQSVVDVQKEHERALQRLQKGEFDEEVAIAILQHAATSDSVNHVWEKSDNKLLGVEELSDEQLKEFIRKLASAT
ncbi:isoflavone reductase family [Fusarium albosuccineum]|uniref:Isoflavone reductase family n=1 Tax=Fusarium albosuccineum TaxID=1237068 RepID=A0A8H4P969_9HYPO|nr:isoflavone reductase family [Fusarium albosuccineum]